MTICLCLSATTNAQSTTYSKQKDKQAKKEYKQKVKEYKRDGWTILGSSHTLEMSLLEHYEALEEEGVFELVGFATSRSKNIGSNQLRQRAAAAYAQESGSHIKERVIEETSSNLDNDDLDEFEKFYAAYETSLEREIQGEVRSSYSLLREIKLNGKKTYEFQGIFLVNEEEASKARQAALKRAVEETKLRHEWATLVSEFIDAPLTK